MDASSNDPPKPEPENHFGDQREALGSLSVPHVESSALLLKKAQELLYNSFGGQQKEKEAEGHAHGGLGLLAQHTSYYDGFAVILSLSQATVVIIRRSELNQTRIVFEDRLIKWSGISKEQNDKPGRQKVLVWHKLVGGILNKFLAEDTFVDVAVVSSVPPGCLEAFLASLSVAVAKASFDLQQQPLPKRVVGPIRLIIEEAIAAEFSKGFVMVSLDVDPGMLCIIDTTTEELIPFSAPARDQLSWGLIEVEMGTPRKFDFYHECGEKGNEALKLLRETQFAHYASFRDVQHEDLPRVLSTLPQKYRSIVRHLVNENKRVQAMIGAIRGVDWQKLGGLLLISHASLSNEWHGTNKAIDSVVSEAGNMSSDGIYGACMTGRGGSVLIVGLPLALPHFMKEIKKQLKERLDREPNCLIL